MRCGVLAKLVPCNYAASVSPQLKGERSEAYAAGVHCSCLRLESFTGSKHFAEYKLSFASEAGRCDLCSGVEDKDGSKTGVLAGDCCWLTPAVRSVAV